MITFTDHRRITVLIAIFITTLFSSCNNHEKEIIAAFCMMEESMEVSNKTISTNTAVVLASIDQKKADPGTAEKVKLIYPQIIKLKQLSADMIRYIDAVKDSLHREAGGKQTISVVTRFFEQRGRGDTLYERLLRYKADMLTATGDATDDFENGLLLTTVEFDSSKTQDFTKTFLYNIPVEAAMAVLSKFKANVYTIEQKTITWLHNKIIYHGTCERTAAFIMLNSGCVMPGEYIEITSGVGSMVTNPKPLFIINKKPVAMDGSGVAIAKLHAPAKPGKYGVPVEVNYTNEDGKQVTVSKTVYYTVFDKDAVRQ